MSVRSRFPHRLWPALGLLGLAGWVLGQGVEIKTSDGAVEQQRLKIESGAATVNAYLMNSKVGIGTATPARKLDVVGTITSTGSDANFTSNGWARNLELPHGGAVMWKKGAGDYAFGIGKSSAASELYFFRSLTDDAANPSIYDMVINNAGFVGIGTTAPGTPLDVSDTGTLGIRYLKTGSRDARISIGDPTQTWSLSSGWATAGDFSLIEEGVSGNRIYVQRTTGNVGLGTSTPNAAFVAPGQSSYGANTAPPGSEPLSTFGGGSGLSENDRSTANRWVVYPNADQLHIWDSWAGDRVRIVGGANGSWTGYMFDNSRTVSLENNAGLPGGGGLRVWDQSGAGELMDIQSNGDLEIGGNRIRNDGSRTASSGGTVRLNDGDNNIWFRRDAPGAGNYHFFVDVTNVKNFIIDHPTDRNKHLIHTTLEGPENAVFYRGTARLVDGKAEIVLPGYFEALTREEGRTVLVAPACETLDEPASALAHSRVRDGRFLVKALDARNPGQRFSWEVKAVRKDVAPLLVEPRKDEVEVHGVGPYKYYDVKRFSLYPD